MSAPHVAAGGVSLVALPVPDGSYTCAVESVDLVHGVKRGARGAQPTPTTSIAWVFRVTEGPRIGATIRKSSACNTPGQLWHLRRELAALGVERASEARGRQAAVTVATEGQWRRVAARAVATIGAQSQRSAA